MKKPKPYVATMLADTPPDTFSPFNIKNLNLHKEDVKLDADILKLLHEQVMFAAYKKKLHPLEIVQAYFDLLQINVVEFYQVDHTAPKLFVLGLTLLKNSHTFAEQTAINNGILSSMSNLKIIKEQLQALAKTYNLDYDSLPTMTKNIGLNAN